MPYGKRRTSRSKAVKPLQPTLEESLYSPQSFFNYKYITKMYALLCLQPVKLCLYFGHSVAHNPYNYYTASLVLYGPLEDGIGWRESGWHCRRSSMLNSIGGARTCAFFQVDEVLFARLSSVILPQ